MFPILDGQYTARCLRDGDVTGLAMGFGDFLKRPDGLQCEPRNMSDVDCHARYLIPPSSPGRTLYHDAARLAPPAAF